MTDDSGNGKNRKLLGHARIDQARKWPGWKEYEASAADVSRVIKAQGEAKDTIRAHIKSDLVKKQKITSDLMVDFQRQGDIVNIYQENGTKKRRRSASENLF